MINNSKIVAIVIKFMGSSIHQLWEIVILTKNNYYLQDRALWDNLTLQLPEESLVLTKDQVKDLIRFLMVLENNQKKQAKLRLEELIEIK